MPITPTSLIAVSGLVQGSGIQIPTALTDAVSAIQNNPLVSTVSSLNAAFTYSGVTIPAAIATLPSSLTALTQLQGTASGILTQAQSILPAGTFLDPARGIKSFMSVFNSSAAFGSASAEYSAALSQFGNKSFADLGVNMANFQDVITNGTTAMSKGLGALANKAATDAFGGLASVLDPNLLAKGKAALQSSGLTDGLQSVGKGLQNFGTLFDFSSPASLGPKNLIANLQKQGLADRNGINDMISDAGHDPLKLDTVPDSVLTDVLSKVKGSDLDKILKQTGANPYQTVLNAGQLLQASNLLPPQATAVLGIAAKGPAALKAMGSTLSNLGASIDNFKMSDLVSGIENKALQYLGQIKSLIPLDVKTALAPILGSGGGLFGNPQMKDMIGSVAGVGHTNNLTSAGKGVTSLQNSAAGKSLQTATDGYANAVKAFIDANPGADPSAVLADPAVAAALGSLTSATNAFQSAVSGNADLTKLVSNIGTSVTASVTALAKEVDNLAKAGMELVDNVGAAITQAFNKGYQTILAFGSKLHKMGQDIQNLGFNDFLPKMATSNVAGDAIQASLVEGRNIARSSAAGQSTPIVADEKKEISAAQTSNLESLKSAYLAAAKEKDLASKELFSDAARGPNGNAICQRYEASQRAKEDAEQAMKSAARAAGIPASELPFYKSNNSFN
jgi:hypothetical protein